MNTRPLILAGLALLLSSASVEAVPSAELCREQFGESHCQSFALETSGYQPFGYEFLDEFMTTELETIHLLRDWQTVSRHQFNVYPDGDVVLWFQAFEPGVGSVLAPGTFSLETVWFVISGDRPLTFRETLVDFLPGFARVPQASSLLLVALGLTLVATVGVRRRTA